MFCKGLLEISIGSSMLAILELVQACLQGGALLVPNKAGRPRLQ